MMIVKIKKYDADSIGIPKREYNAMVGKIYEAKPHYSMYKIGRWVFGPKQFTRVSKEELALYKLKS